MTYVLLGSMNVFMGLIVALQLRTYRMVNTQRTKPAELPSIDHVINQTLAQLDKDDWAAVLGGNYDHLRQKFAQLAAQGPAVDTDEVALLKQSRAKLIEGHGQSIQNNAFAAAELKWREVERINKRIKAIEAGA